MLLTGVIYCNRSFNDHENGGLWLLLFVVFAETGLFIGFFLPGDSLLFVAGIYAHEITTKVVK